MSTPNVLKLSADLRPLMFWMSNATELLNFFQVKVEALEKEWEFEGEMAGLLHKQNGIFGILKQEQTQMIHLSEKFP